MLHDICGNSDIWRNYRAVVSAEYINLDVCDFYGYPTWRLLNDFSGEEMYYKKHLAQWIIFEKKYFLRVARNKNNIARQLGIIHRKAYVIVQLRTALNTYRTAYIGLHDWLTTTYVYKVELLELLQNEMFESLHRLVICETKNGGYLFAQDYRDNNRSNHTTFGFGFDSTKTTSSKRIIIFKDYMETIARQIHEC